MEKTPMQTIWRIIKALVENPFSTFFTILIASVFFISVFAVIRKTKKSSMSAKIANIGPECMTTLGILGTFLGILIGLLEFDTLSIKTSVPRLLEGLKVAFATSILGLFLSIIFKIFFENKSKESFGIVDIIKELKSARTSNEKCFRELKNALANDEESSVTGQLKLLRAETITGFNDQIKEFKNFAKDFSKAFSEAIIAELKDVIHNFNEKISEQFGENFKQLNIAVGRLLQWQEEYRVHIEKTQIFLDKYIKTIQGIDTSIGNIKESCEKIPGYMEKLDGVSSKLLTQTDELENRLNAFSEMKKSAIEAFPYIEKNIKNLTNGMENCVEQYRSSMKEIQDQFNQLTKQATENMNISIKELSKSLEEELGRVAQKMAEELGGISEKLSKDYAPLIEKWREIVELNINDKAV